MNKLKLNKLRSEIDLLDNKLLAILAKRFVVAEKIGKLKKERGILPLDAKRWNIVLKNVVKKGKNQGLSKKLIEHIYNAIHEYSLEIQNKIK